ncbi:hypothetical protein DL93DRAFT_91 [Clavulina sp. PMI_390]|nr:hypothetical protein DL93DRAFT_91 [Clavulina sp. PMI_390]
MTILSNSSEGHVSSLLDTLPVELLARIFVTGLYSYSSTCDAEGFLSSVGCVSWRWNNITMSTPAMWSRIAVRNKSRSQESWPLLQRRVTRHLELSKETSLDLLLDLPWVLQEEIFTQFVDTLSPHFHRCAWLEIRLYHPNQWNEVFPLKGDCGHLRSLTIAFATAVSSMPARHDPNTRHPIFVGATPASLMAVNLQGHDHIVPLLPTPSSNLGELHIQCTFLQWELFGHYLGECHLQNLNLLVGAPDTGLPYGRPLQSCYIRRIAATSLTFCWAIDSQNLRELVLFKAYRERAGIVGRALSLVEAHMGSLWTMEECRPLARLLQNRELHRLQLQQYAESPLVLSILLNGRVPHGGSDTNDLDYEAREESSLLLPNLKQLHLTRYRTDEVGVDDDAAVAHDIVALLDQRPELHISCFPVDISQHGHMSSDEIRSLYRERLHVAEGRAR